MPKSSVDYIFATENIVYLICGFHNFIHPCLKTLRPPRLNSPAARQHSFDRGELQVAEARRAPFMSMERASIWNPSRWRMISSWLLAGHVIIGGSCDHWQVTCRARMRTARWPEWLRPVRQRWLSRNEVYTACWYAFIEVKGGRKKKRSGRWEGVDGRDGEEKKGTDFYGPPFPIIDKRYRFTQM